MTIERLGSQTITPNMNRLTQIQTTDRSILTLKNVQQNEHINTKVEGYEKKGQKQAIEEAVDKINGLLEPVRRNLKFELHDKLDKYYVSVVDSDTSEVIKEIPPKEMLDMYAAMAEFMGLLVDRKI